MSRACFLVKYSSWSGKKVNESPQLSRLSESHFTLALLHDRHRSFKNKQTSSNRNVHLSGKLGMLKSHQEQGSHEAGRSCQPRRHLNHRRDPLDNHRRNAKRQHNELIRSHPLLHHGFQLNSPPQYGGLGRRAADAARA